jgi:F-type H+-transporting ATPase subunit b
MFASLRAAGSSVFLGLRASGSSAGDQLAAQEEPNPILPHVPEMIVGVIAFGLLYWVLRQYALPRFEQVFRARTDAIEGGIKRAEEAQAEAQRLLELYRGQLAEARTEAAQIRDHARAEGQRIIDEMRAEAQAESARIVQRGEEQLLAQRQQITRALRAEIGTLSVQLAERIVGETLADETRQRGTVDRFLDELDRMSAPAAVGSPVGESADGGPVSNPGSGPTSRDGGGSGGGSSSRSPRRRG